MTTEVEIKIWIQKINKSKLTVSAFFDAHMVPFSKSQYYVYKRILAVDPKKSLAKREKNKKLTVEAEEFIINHLGLSENLNLSNLQKLIKKRYDCKMSISGLSKAISRLPLTKEFSRQLGRPKNNKTIETYNVMGGFELIVAIAYHLKWPDRISALIKTHVDNFKKSSDYKLSNSKVKSDRRFRNKSGQFTKKYNQRKDVRANKFKSIDDKKKTKNWDSMNIFHDSAKALSRKSMAVFSLPIVTLNGSTRNINTATAQSLKHFSGYDYKQSSINKFLSELKYLGISTSLLKDLPLSWKEYWKSDFESENNSLICYYVDGNTKALWSSKRVKQNKVTMLGRVMGCLEQVFIHDGLGYPIYFETYSGQAPTGEYVLELFDKIKNVIEDPPKAHTDVYRAIVMDGANNSAKTLKSFVEQKKYHYITPLDDNQFKQRMIIHKDRIRRYRNGKASLFDLEIDLNDSSGKNQVLRTRAIEINWDNGKHTVLMTNLPKEYIDSTTVVWSYFQRWPCQELQFKKGKSTICLSKIAGYGKKIIDNKTVLDKRIKLEEEITKIKNEIKKPLFEIEDLENILGKYIKKERLIKRKSKIKDNKIVLNKKLSKDFKDIGLKISKTNRQIKSIEASHKKNINKFRKKQKEWLRLEKKEKIYTVDVELDQILTFFKISLSGFLAYFVKNILKKTNMDINGLIHKIIHLPAKVEITENERIVTLIGNEKDPMTMKLLKGAIAKINAYRVIGPHGKVIFFKISGFV